MHSAFRGEEIQTSRGAPEMATHALEKKPWWMSSRKVVERQVKEAGSLISAREIHSALSLLDLALSQSPSCELALELKARCLLHLRRFKDVADMLQDHIPSYKLVRSSFDSGDSSFISSENSYQPFSGDRVDSLRSKCFSVSDLKKKLFSGIPKSCVTEPHWRYVVLGQACCHLGLMEDAVALLLAGKRLAAAASRHHSNRQSEDSFSAAHIPLHSADAHHPPPLTESELINRLIGQIKQLLRRRAAAVAALDAGLYSESIRNFSKILDGRRPAPPPFLAECYLGRSAAHRAAGRITDSFADANKTLALEPASVAALIARASLFELLNCPTDAVHDLEHAKLLLNSVLRDRRLPGIPAWRASAAGVSYREIPGRLCQVSAKIQRLKARIAAGETGLVDFHALIGVRKGCSRSELNRAHLLLSLKHRPDRAFGFLEKCEFASESDRLEAHDRARMSTILLYRLIQRSYSTVGAVVAEDEKAEKERARVAAVLQQAQEMAQQQKPVQDFGSNRVYPGNFCRELAASRFSSPLPVNYEALSC